VRSISREEMDRIDEPFAEVVKMSARRHERPPS